ncbi:MAG TPA: dihydrolipoamide acetyltransferase family protein, partial [Ktedonobacterales bacterium]
MSTTITMPQLGESVAEGTVGRWLKQEGDTIQRDESLVEIITDKVTAELPSPVAGRLSKILVAADQTVRVGTPIAEIEDGSATTGAGSATSASASAPAQAAPSFSSPTMPAPSASGYAAPAPSASSAAVAVADAPNGAADYRGNYANGYAFPAPDRGDRVSPLARRMAQEHHVDLARIQGTGEGGRVRKEDILAYVEQRDRATAPRMATVTTSAPPLAPPSASQPPVMPPPPVAAPAPIPTGAASQPPAPPAPPVTATEGDQLVTPTPMRRVIAEHMVRSKRTSPHATTLVEVDMTGLTHWLEHNREDFKRREGYGISYVPFVVKATVEALKAFPYLNASWTEDNKIILRKQIHIGVSIAVENGLLVPVIRNADTLSIAGLARAVSDLATRART